jgi:hypothetical protein
VSVANEELWHCWPSFKNFARAFNNYKPGASHQTRVEKQMSNPRFPDLWICCALLLCCAVLRFFTCDAWLA